MLLALLARRFAQPLARTPAPATADPDRSGTAEAALRDIAQRISAGGADRMSNADILIWNTAVVVSFMTGDRRIAVPPDAKVLNWGAARAGFREMRLPALAEFVRLFVIEMAYRADLDGRDREANSASLLRIADLKQRFRAVEAQVDFAYEFDRMIARLHRRSGRGASATWDK
jgi:hypothetical protein